MLGFAGKSSELVMGRGIGSKRRRKNHLPEERRGTACAMVVRVVLGAAVREQGGGRERECSAKGMVADKRLREMAAERGRRRRKEGKEKKEEEKGNLIG